MSDSKDKKEEKKKTSSQRSVAVSSKDIKLDAGSSWSPIILYQADTEEKEKSEYEKSYEYVRNQAIIRPSSEANPYYISGDENIAVRAMYRQFTAATAFDVVFSTETLDVVLTALPKIDDVMGMQPVIVMSLTGDQEAPSGYVSTAHLEEYRAEHQSASFANFRRVNLPLFDHSVVGYNQKLVSYKQLTAAYNALLKYILELQAQNPNQKIKLLCHCAAGRERSAIFLAGFLMWWFGYLLTGVKGLASPTNTPTFDTKDHEVKHVSSAQQLLQRYGRTIPPVSQKEETLIEGYIEECNKNVESFIYNLNAIDPLRRTAALSSIMYNRQLLRIAGSEEIRWQYVNLLHLPYKLYVLEHVPKSRDVPGIMERLCALRGPVKSLFAQEGREHMPPQIRGRLGAEFVHNLAEEIRLLDRGLDRSYCQILNQILNPTRDIATARRLLRHNLLPVFSTDFYNLAPEDKEIFLDDLATVLTYFQKNQLEFDLTKLQALKSQLFNLQWFTPIEHAVYIIVIEALRKRQTSHAESTMDITFVIGVLEDLSKIINKTKSKHVGGLFVELVKTYIDEPRYLTHFLQNIDSFGPFLSGGQLADLFFNVCIVNEFIDPNSLKNNPLMFVKDIPVKQQVEFLIRMSQLEVDHDLDLPTVRSLIELLVTLGKDLDGSDITKILVAFKQHKYFADVLKSIHEIPSRLDKDQFLYLLFELAGRDSKVPLELTIPSLFPKKQLDDIQAKLTKLNIVQQRALTVLLQSNQQLLGFFQENLPELCKQLEVSRKMEHKM